jgi:uncharacterized membrane protein
MIKTKIFFFALLVLSLGAVFVSNYLENKISISEELIQEKANEKLPLSGNKGAVGYIVSEAKINLNDNGTITLNALGSSSVKDNSIKFNATLNSEIDFDRNAGQLFLYNVTLIDLVLGEVIVSDKFEKYKSIASSIFGKARVKQLNNFMKSDSADALKDKYTKKLTPLIQERVTKALEGKPIYTLNEENNKQAAVKYFIKDITVVEDTLLIDLVILYIISLIAIIGLAFGFIRGRAATG